MTFLQLCGKNFARTHHLKRHMQGVHKGSKGDGHHKPSPMASKVVVGARKKSVVVPAAAVVTGGGTIYRLNDAATGETVLVTTEDDGTGNNDGDVIIDANLVQTEYIVEDQSGNKYTACKSVFK
jgi:hypothetical protein